MNRVTAEKLDVEGPVFDKFLDSCSQGGTGDDVTVAIAFSREKLLRDGLRGPRNIEDERSETKSADPECSELAVERKPQESTTDESAEGSGSDGQAISEGVITRKVSLSQSAFETTAPVKEVKSGGASTEAGDVF